MKTAWSFEKALNIIQQIEACLAPHYHVGLLGSVLHHGDSSNDLDIVIFPHSSPHFQIEEVHALLKTAGLELKVTRERVIKYWRKEGSVDNKYVEVWLDDKDRRIDIFYWKDFT